MEELIIQIETRLSKPCFCNGYVNLIFNPGLAEAVKVFNGKVLLQPFEKELFSIANNSSSGYGGKILR